MIYVRYVCSVVLYFRSSARFLLLASESVDVELVDQKEIISQLVLLNSMWYL